MIQLSLGSKDSAVTVGVLEGSISVRDDEGDFPLLQEDQVGQESFLQSVNSEVVLPVLQISAHPLVDGGVVLFPGVGRGNDEESSGSQHFLQEFLSTLITR